MASIPIPGPPPLPVLGNLTDIDPNDAMASLLRLADTYGDIFKLTIGGSERIFISSVALLNEVCDETKFTKAVSGALEQIRNGVEDGLFTAYPGEHNWEVAHRTLMPAFGPLSIRSMFSEMHDIASQLVVKWARFGSKEKIDVSNDFTRLTLDSIALCAMDTRFNSFYKDELHPFVNAMVGLLQESGARARRPAFTNYFMRSAQKKYDDDITLLKNVATEVVAERRQHPSDRKDLLNAMMLGKDPKSGEGLTDASIINNMITFLIAGHETTSGLLSFLFYYLIKNPESYQKAQAEVDEVIGKGPITTEHLPRLHFLSACLRETLRLTPTAPAFSLQPLPELMESSLKIGGRYEVKKGQSIVALLPKIQQDPLVYGSDAGQFKPERMLDEPFSKLPPNAWKPFGNGVRGCIGRPFAWQEALLTTAMLLQAFDFRFDDPSYTLAIKQTLTLKPKGFYMHATIRDHLDATTLEKRLHIDTSQTLQPSKSDKALTTAATAASGGKKETMHILYGSNSGTCEALAGNLARMAGGRGFDVKVDVLDAAVNHVPKGHPIVMITSSYEGQPPDNAAHFMAWLASLKGGTALEGVKYAVYGCGNHEWSSTFHKVPKELDQAFEANGAIRISAKGLGDVAEGDIFNEFDTWQDEIFFPGLGSAPSASKVDSGIELEIDTASRSSTLRQQVREATIISNEILTAPGVPEKRHIVLELPTGMEYKTGDYLAVLPINSPKTIRRVLKRFGLPWDAILSIKSSNATSSLPTDHPISAMDLLGAYVELSQPATKRHVQEIASSIAEANARAKVQRLASEDFTTVLEQRLSPLDILETYPSAALPLSSFLAMLPPMRIRQYSISSSPLLSATTATITWSVLNKYSPTSITEPQKPRHFLGVASNYLSSLEAKDRVHVAVKPSHGAFHPPADIAQTPIIMLSAGTGLAPFRGFVQERAIQSAAGRTLAPAYLFIGCADPALDRLFGAEIDEWAAAGVVRVFYAFSRKAQASQGAKYVQDRLWLERKEVREAFENGAKIYVCGSARVGLGVEKVAKDIYIEAARNMGLEKTEEEVAEWFRGVKGERFASDVFD